MSAASRAFQVSSIFWSGRQPIRPGMNQAGEAHARHVARVGVHARNVPDRLLRQREVVGQKAAAILLGEEAVEAPGTLRQDADIEKIDDQEIARLGALDTDRPGEEVHDA